MNKAHLRRLNELIIESTLEASDDDILALIDSPGWVSSKEIAVMSDNINVQIKRLRDARLSKQKQDFIASQSRQQSFIENSASGVTIDSMLKSIVAVMTRPGGAPESLLLAFREQSGKLSDEGIIETWKNLIELGLIDPNDTKN